MRELMISVACSLPLLFAVGCGSERSDAPGNSPPPEQPSAIEPFHIVSPRSGQAINTFPIQFEVSELPSAATHYHMIVSKADSDCSVPYAIDGGFGRTIKEIGILGGNDFKVGDQIYICVSAYQDEKFLSTAENTGIGVTVVDNQQKL